MLSLLACKELSTVNNLCNATLSSRKIYINFHICELYQGLSIQRDRKHCINFADNKNYLVSTVPYLQTLQEGDDELI